MQASCLLCKFHPYGRVSHLAGPTDTAPKGLTVGIVRKVLFGLRADGRVGESIGLHFLFDGILVDQVRSERGCSDVGSNVMAMDDNDG